MFLAELFQRALSCVSRIKNDLGNECSSPLFPRLPFVSRVLHDGLVRPWKGVASFHAKACKTRDTHAQKHVVLYLIIDSDSRAAPFSSSVTCSFGRTRHMCIVSRRATEGVRAAEDSSPCYHIQIFFWGSTEYTEIQMNGKLLCFILFLATDVNACRLRRYRARF